MLPVERTAHGIAIVSLTANPSKPRGGVVVLDSWLIAEIAATLDAVAATAPTGIVLRSASERVFVAGADLAEIDSLDDTALDAYLRRGSDAFARLHHIPCATVALVHRAALGGGLEVAMHCDGIVGVLARADEKPWRIGLPECSLGICPGWGGTQMLPARIDPATAIAQTATGQTNPVNAIPTGLFDLAVTAGDDALRAALDWLAAHPRTASRSQPTAIHAGNAADIRSGLATARADIAKNTAENTVKNDAANAVLDCVEIGINEGWQAALAAERAHLVALRRTPVAREKLAQFLKPAG